MQKQGQSDDSFSHRPRARRPVGGGALAGAAVAGMLAIVAALAMPASRSWQLRLLAAGLTRRVLHFFHLFPPAGGPHDLL
jgi:hypothetical protein